MRSGLAIFAAAALTGISVLTGCSRTDYSQGTPEETIASANKMVEAGDAEKLPNLVYAENPDMRKLLNTLGRMTGHLEELAKEINTRYPQETAELAKKAEEAAKAVEDLKKKSEETTKKAIELKKKATELQK